MIINTNNAIILYLEETIIDLYVRGGHPGGHLGFQKSHAGGEWPPGLNLIATLQTTETKQRNDFRQTKQGYRPRSSHWTIRPKPSGRRTI